jgi:predicted TIM-barrel fold metal-dependent hydrolase
MSAPAVPADVVDCLVHPICSDRALYGLLPDPWRRYTAPKPEHYLYPPPSGEYVPGLELAAEHAETRLDGRGRPPAIGVLTPEQVRREVLDRGGARQAILLPLGRGVQSDQDFDAALATAFNEWLAVEWLAPETNPDGRFKGSIRVSARNPARAVAEIRRWADHPHMVQVAVPLQALAPYGDQAYLPIWTAAAERGLPVVVHADTGAGTEPPPTAMGYPLTAYAAHVLQPLNGVIHLASLVAEGVFSRLPDLRWVAADGAYHAYAPIFWRFNNEWRESRFQTPWVDRQPSEFFERHVRFVIRGGDVSTDLDRTAAFLELAHAESLVLFGSGFPYWDAWTPAEAAERLPGAYADAIFHGNADAFYRLEVRS